MSRNFRVLLSCSAIILGSMWEKNMPVLGYILMFNIILKHYISVISTSEDSFL
jgi:hypothetical protein